MKFSRKPTTTLRTTVSTTFALCVASTLMPPVVGAVPPPGAYELLARVDAAYRSLAAYADSGSLEVCAPGDPARRFGFETRWNRATPTFLLRLDRIPAPGSRPPWKVLWRAPSGEVRHWDADRHQVKSAASLAVEVAHHLPADAGWPGGADALPVPALLLGLDVLRDPDAAALEGEEACRDEGSERCRVVALSRLNGSVAIWLWVEEGSGWIRRSEVELRQPFGSDGAPGAAPGAAETWRLRWEIDPRIATRSDRPSEEEPGMAGEVEEVRVAFEPPADARRVETWEGSEIGGEPGDGEPGAVFGEVLEVGLTTVQVRVVDRAGRPVPGLSAEDFRVSVRPDRKTGTARGGSVELAAEAKKRPGIRGARVLLPPSRWEP